MNVRLVLSLVLAALVVLFVVQNSAVVEVRYLAWTVQVSRALLIFFVLAIGIVMGWLLRGQIARRHDKPPKRA